MVVQGLQFRNGSFVQNMKVKMYVHFVIFLYFFIRSNFQFIPNLAHFSTFFQLVTKMNFDNFSFCPLGIHLLISSCFIGVKVILHILAARIFLFILLKFVGFSSRFLSPFLFGRWPFGVQDRFITMSRFMIRIFPEFSCTFMYHFQHTAPCQKHLYLATFCLLHVLSEIASADA